METPEYLLEHIDDIGTPRAYNHYAVGWAHAMNTPYQTRAATGGRRRPQRAEPSQSPAK